MISFKYRIEITHERANMSKENVVKPRSGWPVLASIFLMGVIGVFTFVSAAVFPPMVLIGVGLIVVSVVSLFGFMAIAPNDSRVLLLFGEYRGTVKDSGFF